MEDPNDLISVYEAANPAEANLVKNLLRDEEIEAFVADEHSPYVGLSFAASDVLAPRKHVASAREIIDRYEQQQIARADRPDWTCEGCGAAVIGAFDECDVCGAPRDPNAEDAEESSE